MRSARAGRLPLGFECSLRFFNAEFFGAQAFHLASEFGSAGVKLSALEIERGVLLAEIARARGCRLRGLGANALGQRFGAGRDARNGGQIFALADELFLLGLEALAHLREALGRGNRF